MSGWDSRIQIRTDNAAAYKGTPEATLNAGELAAGVESSSVEIRSGLSSPAGYTSSPIIAKGAVNAEMLTAEAGASLSDGDLIAWEGDWSAGATAIAWSTATASGAVTYTDSTDTWSINAALNVITDADGGTFTGSYTAPAFSSGYDPTIGEP
jgi:hypothetical protein